MPEKDFNMEDKKIQEFVEAFNIGYSYSKLHPDMSKKILDETNPQIQNQDGDNIESTTGVIQGMKEYQIELEKLQSLEQIKDFRRSVEQDEKELGNDLDKLI